MDGVPSAFDLRGHMRAGDSRAPLGGLELRSRLRQRGGMVADDAGAAVAMPVIGIPALRAKTHNSPVAMLFASALVNSGLSRDETLRSSIRMQTRNTIACEHRRRSWSVVAFPSS